MSNTYIYHHGIKGQKWGVRRFQNVDGSLTRLSKKRKSEENDVDKTTKKLTYKQKIAVGSVAATAVLATYGAYRLSNSRNIDRVIKVGKDLYRTGHTNEASEGLNELVYATIKKSDAKKYYSLISDGKNYKIQNNERVKVAGIKSAEKIYNDLIKNNTDFRSHYGNMSYKDFNGSLGFANRKIIEQNKLCGMKVKDMYMNPFFNALRSNGYNAVVDTQDTFAKVPVILLNMAGEYRIKD